ncbi:MAG: type II toxin-antitoxin system prevent-host-death family antitoxin [bacterium]
MAQVTLLEFRQHAHDILKRVENGEEVILTRRGKPAAKLVPAANHATLEIREADPIYHLAEHAGDLGRLSNADMDKVVYGDD